tara:strand:+ start:656 stop:2134 length:1479 start_codon:yes stop_codon:yes gene_type:complete
MNNNFLRLNSDIKIYFILILLLLILRTYHSFFNLSVGEHDWTFLLVGRSLYNGNLPFIETWNMTGPIVFIFYAIPFYFENYIAALKLSGIISIWIACIFTYETSKKLFGLTSGIFASVGLAIITSSEESFLTSEVEIFILPFLSVYIYFIFKDFLKSNLLDIILAALSISLATLIRPSLGLVAFLGTFIFLFSYEKKIQKTLIYIFSGIVPLMILLFLYSRIPDGINIFWRSTFDAHLAYPAGRPFFLGFFQFIENFGIKQWYSLFILSFIIIFFNKDYLKELLVMALFVSVIIISFCLTRKFSDYYVLICFPFLIIMSSSILDEKLNISKILIVPLVILILFAPALNNVVEQIKLKYRPINKTQVLHNELKDIIRENDTLFSLDNGLYILFDKPLPTKIAHPSNLFKHYSLSAYYGIPNYGTEDELSLILQSKPDYLVFLEKWKARLPKKIKNIIDRNYIVYNFIDTEKIKKFKRVNREYLNSITLYKLIK